MGNLIHDINACFLALHSGNKKQFERYDIVLLKDQFEINPKYSGREFDLLRKAFSDLFDINRQKLNHYKNRIFIPSPMIDGQKPDHEVLKDIYSWANLNTEPYFERYINLIKPDSNTESNTTSQVANQKIDFKIYLKDDWADKLCELLAEKMKNSVAGDKAKWIFVFYERGLFKPEMVPDEKALYAKHSDFVFRDFYYAIQALTGDTKDQERRIKEGIKDLFDEKHKKSLESKLNPDFMGYFDEINKILVKPNL